MTALQQARFRPGVFIAVALMTLSASAQPPEGNSGPGGQDDGDGMRPHGPPPQVAIDACAKSTEGAACSFTGRRGDTIGGICRKVPEGVMACVPKHPPFERRQGGQGSDNRGPDQQGRNGPPQQGSPPPD